MQTRTLQAASQILLSAVGLTAVLARPTYAQDALSRVNALQDLNGSVTSLVSRVSQSVVQVLVTSYGPLEATRSEADLVIGRERSMGSGVIIDAGGYILTNAHVIANARRVQVVLPSHPAEGSGVRMTSIARGRTVDAQIVGVAREIDLALLKVEDAPLVALPIADYDELRQGELVFAFGSPEGLRNSVTMGIVSAVARQPAADNPLVYIQTDAPINHGNSGGPLVNVRGQLVGINTFILSETGGSQGLGFAIPSALVEMAYPKLRQFGRLHRGEVGMQLQSITPTLAAGLQLSQDWGAMIADVTPGGPADAAGLRPQDIVVSIDGEPVDGVPRLAFELLTHSAGDHLRLEVTRGADRYVADVAVGDRQHDFDRLTDFLDPDTSLISRLGILGVNITDENASLAASLRQPSGVIVVGHTKDDAGGEDMGLMTADAIHAVNGRAVSSVEQLRSIVDALKPRSAVVLQVERNGQFTYLAFELD
jgi:serine protease Do